MIFLIIFFITLLTGGPEQIFLIDNLKKEIKQNVDDKEIKDELLNTLEITTKEIKKFNKCNDKGRKKVKKLVQKKSSSSDLLNGILNNALILRIEHQKKMIESRLFFQEKMNIEQWNKIISTADLPSEKDIKEYDAVIEKDKKAKKKLVDKVREAISNGIEEPSKQEIIITSFNEFEYALNNYLDEARKINFTNNKIVRNHNASKADLQGIYDYQNKLRKTVYQEFIEMHQIASEKTTLEEWNKISNSFSKLF